MKILLVLSLVFLLGALSHELGWVPRASTVQAELLTPRREAPAPLPKVSAAREPRAEAEIQIARIWDAPHRGYAQIQLRNDGDAILRSRQASIRCTAFDAEDRVLGSQVRSNAKRLTPGERTELVIEIDLGGTQSFESIQCKLDPLA